ncbi:MAG: tRNA (N(6)-L-threonylcarbamoyladenosine(37)-C(2))-methylthiotransferase MtaB [Desulfobulbus propionicus]|nr:MAG: tRNA (N(6)-L-threonylcarbamoyladenosine(37)-C(2))-methylthiotransferase MtaB [Desulfobulbus propionicus]
MQKVAISTLGCKVNQFESASFTTGLSEAGCELVPFADKADVYIINSCTVTAKAGQQSRQLIRRARHNNPKARIIVTGCYVQMDPDTVLDIIGDKGCIIGNDYKHLLVDTTLQENHPELVMLMGKISNQQHICDLPVRTFGGRTRAYIRVQDGCNNFCTYCIVPYTRGPSRSLRISSVLEQVAVFLDEGYKELVITGINIGKYGLDTDENQTIYSLLEQICQDFPSLRIRLSSIEPPEVNAQLLDIMATHPNFMPHLHIPLQSGDDEVLRRMYRQYNTKYFRTVIEKIHTALPHAAIGCDVLGGFPGETEQQADNTYALIRDLPLSYLHVFPYSKRHGTLAASYKNHLPGPVKTQRVKRLRELDSQLRERFYTSQVGTTVSVLVERQDKKSQLLQGFSENYLPLHFSGSTQLIHQVIPVHVDRVQNGQPIGTVSQELLEEKQVTK